MTNIYSFTVDPVGEIKKVDNQIKRIEKSMASTQVNPNDVPGNIFLQAKRANLKNLQDQKKRLEKQLASGNKYKKK